MHKAFISADRNRSNASAARRGRRWATALTAVCLGLLTMPVPALAQTATARDAVTGRSIEATLTMAPAPAQLAAIESLVRARLDEAGDTRSLALGPATLLALEAPAAARVEAAGYRTLYTVLRPSADNRGWTFLLEP
ncbi:MAG: hypothetical protein GVY32_02580, partial [Gammaproteobacteria bacterium]|nr:hypothetical protein [Gammaproteobacteria bacterium]